MKCKNIVVTGTNSGVGLELVKQILQKLDPDNVFATYRDPAKSKELLDLASKNNNLHPVKLDIRDTEKFAEFVENVDMITEGAGLNLLVNNAGFRMDDDSLQDLSQDKLMTQYEINTVGPLLLSKAFLPLLEKASLKAKPGAPMGIEKAAIINICCYYGSITDNKKGTAYGYRMSKTGLHQATKNMSIELKEKGILVIPLNPGYVKTKIGGPRAFMEPESSIREVMYVLENLGEDKAGRFINYFGKETAW